MQGQFESIAFWDMVFRSEHGLWEDKEKEREMKSVFTEAWKKQIHGQPLCHIVLPHLHLSHLLCLLLSLSLVLFFPYSFFIFARKTWSINM